MRAYSAQLGLRFSKNAAMPSLHSSVLLAIPFMSLALSARSESDGVVGR